jgi:hypothetical protein
MKKLLSLVWMGWKRFAHVLGVVNTKILLTLTYFVILSVFSIVARIFGADLLDRRMKTRNSYWHKREPADLSIESARRQF